MVFKIQSWSDPASPARFAAIEAELAQARNDSRLVAASSVLRPMNVAYPANYSPTPTVTFVQTSATSLAGTPQSHRVRADQAMTHVGIVPSYSAANWTMTSVCQSRGTTGVEVDVRADAVEFFYRAGAAGGEYWVWVDDQPVTTAPVAWTGSVAAAQRLKVDFPAVESHRITVYVDLLELQEIRVLAGESVEAAPRRPIKFMAIGDSLTDGSGEAVPASTWLGHAARLLGWEPIMNAYGGSGYYNGSQPFTLAERITAMSDPSIDFYHFKGSINDNGATAANIQAAAETCFQTIYAANPTALILVSGPDATGATASLAANVRANSDAVRAAALKFASKNVIGWVDPLMTRNVAAAWTSGMVLTTGQRVTFEGAVYRVLQNTSTSTFNSNEFGRITPLYGTGRVGTTASNGNRDLFILSDDTHWSLVAHRFFGHYFADHYIKALASYASGQFYLYE